MKKGFSSTSLVRGREEGDMRGKEEGGREEEGGKEGGGEEGGRDEGGRE